MAPMAVADHHALKRTSSQAQLDEPVPKKQDRSLRQPSLSKEEAQKKLTFVSSLRDEEISYNLLTRAISLALDSVGFAGADPKALEAFHQHVEEYLHRFLSVVRQSMLASRRIRILPEDFLQALHTSQLSLRALLPHLDPPVAASDSQFSLSARPRNKDVDATYRSMSNLFTSPASSETQRYIPKHFPDLPDAHTYKNTPDFAFMEEDPRKIREHVVEEGRLAENALRRLVAAGKRRKQEDEQSRLPVRSLKARRDQAWRAALAAATAAESTGVDAKTAIQDTGGGMASSNEATGRAGLTSIVNSEKDILEIAAWSALRVRSCTSTNKVSIPNEFSRHTASELKAIGGSRLIILGA